MMKMKTLIYSSLLAMAAGLGMGASDSNAAIDPERMQCLSDCREVFYECQFSPTICRALFDACKANCG